MYSILKDIFICSHIYYYRFSHANDKYNLKISINLNSIIHSIGSSILCSIYLFNSSYDIFYYTKVYSFSYFLNDIFLILKFKLFYKLSNLGLFFHHIVAIYMILYCHPPTLMKGLFVLELSNIPNTLIYHLIKREYPINLIKKYQYYQKYIYSSLRVIYCPYLMYSNLSYLNYWDKGNIFFIYILGVIWSYKLWMQ
jgi:hypothetical protein